MAFGNKPTQATEEVKHEKVKGAGWLSPKELFVLREQARLIGLEFRAALAEERARDNRPTTTNNFN